MGDPLQRGGRVTGGGQAATNGLKPQTQPTENSSMPNRSRPPLQSPARGFTLIELMIAVAIIAIITAVAFPAFLDSMRKSRRSEAFAALSKVQLAQERWRANNPDYTASVTGAWPASGLGLPGTTPSGYYTVEASLITSDPKGYNAVATAVPGTSQASDGTCATLVVRSRGGNISYGDASSPSAGDLPAGNRCWSQ